MFAVLVLMCVWITASVSGKLYENQKADLFAKANITADAAHDTEQAKDLLRKSLTGTHTRGIILDASGEAVFDTNTDASAEGIILTNPAIFTALAGEESSVSHKNETGVKTLSVAVPITKKGAVKGVVFLSKDMTATDRITASVRNRLIIFALILMIAVLLLSIRLSHMVTSPLNEFVSAVQEISKGNFDKKIPVSGTSEMDQLANAINYMSTELEHLEAKRRKFVSDASHELKTPMATIKLICDSITSYENPDTAMVQEFLSDLSDEVDRLTRIIEKLLLLTKLDSKETNFAPELVDFGMMLNRIKNNLDPLAASKNITVTTDIPADLPPVMLDHDRIWEAMYNIIDNAIKYSKIGGGVKISAEAGDTTITVRVIDSGKGIPDDSKERIFERFYRLDDSRTRETGGTGLGLAIAKEAVLLHHGTIKAENNPEEGSCFVITLPYKKDSVAPQNGGESE